MTDVAKQAIDEITENYETVVHSLGKMTKHLGADANDAVTDSAKAFVNAASDLADKIKKQSDSLAKKAGEEVREHPAAAAALAAAAVGLLGYAITHTRKPH